MAGLWEIQLRHGSPFNADRESSSGTQNISFQFSCRDGKFKEKYHDRVDKSKMSSLIKA